MKNLDVIDIAKPALQEIENALNSLEIIRKRIQKLYDDAVLERYRDVVKEW